MKRLIVFVVVSMLFLTKSQAQNVVYDKYYLGVDLHWIWAKYEQDPSLSFKIIDSKRKNGGIFSTRKGYRFRLARNYDKLANLKEVIPGTYFPNHSASFSFLPGYEWHKGYKMFDFFYGFDLLFQARADREVIYYYYFQTNPGGQLDRYMYWTKQQRIGVGPMAGLNIRILEGLNITLKSTFYCSIYRNKYYTTFNLEPPKTFVAHSFQALFAPMNTLNVTFSFR